MNRPVLILTLALSLLMVGCTSTEVREGVDPEKAAEANATLGVRYMLQGNNEVALEKLKRSLEFDDEYAPAHHYLAELYRRLDRPEEADKHFRQAIRYQDPPDSALFNNYGAFLCSNGRPDEGEKQFLKVLDNPVYPRPDQVYENLGLCAEGKPDLEKAEQYLRKALAQNPRLPKSLLAMARISHAAGNHLSTRAYLQRFHAEVQHTPESLWLGIQTERELGGKDAVASYALMLKSRYPEAEETRLYLESTQQD